MSESKNDFSAFLTKSIERIKELTHQNLGEIEDLLAEAIHATRSTIEKWRREVPKAPHKQKKQMPSLEQAEAVGKILFEQGGLSGREEFKKFLEHAEHPYPGPAWNKIFPWINGPNRSEHFIGRESEISALLALLKPREVVTLCGAGGIGKSALVAEVVQRLAPDQKAPTQFPDGIIFHDFYRQPSAELALEQIALIFDEKELQPTPQAAATRALRTRQALIILDGAENADNLRVVVDVVKTCSTCGILIVTRERTQIEEKRNTLFLGLLLPEEAVKVLLAWSIDGQHQSVIKIWSGDHETNAAIGQEICELLGRLPLALRLAGRYMSQTQIVASNFLETLKKTPLALLHEEDRQHQSVRIMIQKILEKVSARNQDAPNVLAVVGLLAYSDFHRQAIANALNTSVDLIIGPLGELVRFSLLNSVSYGRYQVVHRLIYVYAKEHLPAPKKALEQLSTFYYQLAIHFGAEENDALGKAEIQLEYLKNGRNDYEQLDGEREHMLAVLDNCAKKESWVEVQRLSFAIEPYLNYQHRLTERVQTGTVGLKAARALGNRENEYEWLHKLGSMCQTHMPQQAIDFYQQALVIARETNNFPKLDHTFHCLGSLFEGLKQYEQAIICYQQAIIMCRASTTLFKEQTQQIAENMKEATRYRELGQFEHSIESLSRAMAIKITGQDLHVTESQRLSSLGHVYSKANEIEHAIDCFTQILTYAQETKEHFLEASALFDIGLTYNSVGEYDRAIEYIQQAIDIHQKIRRGGESSCWLMMGSIYQKLGKLDKALTCFQKGVTISHQEEIWINESGALLLLGHFYCDVGQMDESVNCFQKLLDLTRKKGNSYDEAKVLVSLGNLYNKLNRVQDAIECYQSAFSIFEELKSPEADEVQRLLENV